MQTFSMELLGFTCRRCAAESGASCGQVTGGLRCAAQFGFTVRGAGERYRNQEGHDDGERY